MGVTIKCEVCQNSSHHDVIENIGTAWHPIWAVLCPHCGAQITWDGGTFYIFDNAQFYPKREGLEVRTPSQKDVRKRVVSSEIREWWIQNYVKENYKKLGFSKIEGPFETGPDFKGVRKGKTIWAEVERDVFTYLQHKHHEDSRFDKVDVLIVLNPTIPPKEIEDKLPREIIYLDVDDFIQWWRLKVKKYAENAALRGLLHLIAEEFEKRLRWLYWGDLECPDRDREMATCPNCDICPYFTPEPRDTLRITAFELACAFLVHRPLLQTKYGYKLSEVEPAELDEFLMKYLARTQEAQEGLG